MNAAAREKANAGQVGQALELTRQLPSHPQDCSQRQTSGVEIGDRLDVALLKTDNALSMSNDRVTRCAEWYESLREGKK